MEVMKRKIDALRFVFNKLHLTLVNLTRRAGSIIDVDNFLVEFDILEKRYQEMAVLSDKYLDILSSSSSEDLGDELINAIEVGDEYYRKYLEVKNLKNGILKASSSCDRSICPEGKVETTQKGIPDSDVEPTADVPDNRSDVSSESRSGKKSQLRLPKLEFIQFDGQIQNWIAFWAQFSNIHEDEELTDDVKFQYLISATKEGSRARALISSFPPSRENYKKAVDALKSRFGRSDMIIVYYVRQLHNLVSNPKDKLDELYDSLVAHLRALESFSVMTDDYAALLFVLVESCIPGELLKIWHRQFGDSTLPLMKQLDSLVDFLRDEVDRNERVQLASVGLSKEPRQQSKSTRPSNKEVSREVNYSAASLNVALNPEVSKDSINNCCIFCDKAHRSSDCFKTTSMTLDQKKEKATKANACFKCLKKGHRSSNCRSSVKCLRCGSWHATVMCDKTESRKVSEGTCNLSLASFSVLLPTVVVTLVGPNKTRLARALLDSGAQRSYVTEKTAKELGLKPTRSVKVKQSLFGHISSKPVVHNCYFFEIRGLKTGYSIKIEALSTRNITEYKGVPFPIELVNKLKRHDIEVDQSCSDIELLIGSDYFGSLLTSQKMDLGNGIVCLETEFGWTVTGTQSPSSVDSNTAVINHINVSEIKLSDLWNLETIGIFDKVKTTEDDLSLKNDFMNHLARNDDGRYCVALPWKQHDSEIQTNRIQAEKRLNRTISCLKRQGLIDEYDEVFKTWLTSDFIERVSEDVPNSRLEFYLPHRAVVKENSTTKLRPVFDASSRDANGVSLNDCLSVGPNLIENIPELLFRFRTFKIGLVADIEKAFQQIEVRETDRDALRFLWKDETGVIIFRHKRVVFGVNSSPFLLAATLENHLTKASADHPRHVVEKLETSFYVDNLVTGVDNMDELAPFVTKSQTILGQAKFNLRGWNSNVESIILDGQKKVENVLGVKWLCDVDHLTCFSPEEGLVLPEIVTKRSLLSCSLKFFDPLGLFSPVTLTPKLLLQRTWVQNITSWDGTVARRYSCCFSKLGQRNQRARELPRATIPRNNSKEYGSYLLRRK